MRHRVMAGWRWVLISLGALLLGGAAVYINVLSQPDPSKNIRGAINGVVPGLAVTDDDFDHWFIPTVSDFHETKTDGDFSFIYYTSWCEKEGFVGFASDRTQRQVRITLVAGESGGSCDDMGVPHRGEITLDEPIGDRRVIVVKPILAKDP